MEFVKSARSVPDPSVATRALSGELPARALQFCEPYLAANAVGYCVYAPVDFTATWTGDEILVEIADIDELLIAERIFLPDFADQWTAVAPAHARDVMPAFIEAFPERGAIQVWTGLFIRTSPGISSWVRAPINRPRSSGYSIVEGVIETDWWTGPLFTVIQMQKTDFPVSFRRDTPFLQVFPCNRDLMRDVPAPPRISTVDEASNEFWSELVATSGRRNTEPPGSYRRAARASARARI